MKKPKKPCEPCSGTRFIESPKLGRVRCPYCRPIKVERVSPKNMKQLLTAVEARRRDRAEVASTVVVDDFKFPDTPAHLLTTFRVLERWGYDGGAGFQVEFRDEFRVAKPPPLDPATYTEVERIINHAPRRTRSFVYKFWRAANSGLALRKMSRRQVGRTKILALHDMKERFLRSKHRDLLDLINFIGE